MHPHLPPISETKGTILYLGAAPSDSEQLVLLCISIGELTQSNIIINAIPLACCYPPPLSLKVKAKSQKNTFTDHR
jgi:hypothetical protein